MGKWQVWGEDEWFVLIVCIFCLLLTSSSRSEVKMEASAREHHSRGETQRFFEKTGYTFNSKHPNNQTGNAHLSQFQCHHKFRNLCIIICCVSRPVPMTESTLPCAACLIPFQTIHFDNNSLIMNQKRPSGLLA